MSSFSRMFRSLQVQILLVIASLVAILLAQAVLSRISQERLIHNQELTAQAIVVVGLVHQLERDVIDLQRNVLIYKDTASESVIIKFNDLLASVNEKLLTFETVVSGSDKESLYKDLIARMRDHLKDYKNNFTGVINGRARRESIYKDKISKDFNSLDVFINQNGGRDDGYAQVNYSMVVARRYLLEYLLTADYDLVEKFNASVDSANTLIEDKKNNINEINRIIKQVKNDFRQLTQVTRGYIFLVNVVMAGSANEFLYLTKEMAKLVTEQQDIANAKIVAESDKTQLQSDVAAAMSIAFALVCAIFLSLRIIIPVRKITSVFRSLAVGGDVTAIPGVGRSDEIGDLAKAANVFHDKNKQAIDLLDKTQKMNAKQELLNIELEKEKNRAEQAAISKSMFLANMSHEIRTPMNGIMGLIRLVLKTDLNDKQKNYLKKIAYSGRIMMEVINDILDFSKIEAGKLDIESVEFSLDMLVENLISAIHAPAAEKGLNFRVNSLSAIPEKLKGDPLRVSQVLLNLCNNAVKFTETGSVVVDVMFVPKADADSAKIVISVSDTGIGMSKEQMAVVFDSFTQADGSTSRKFGGTGLGLTIVKQLTELMGGEIGVESIQGEGSCFKMSCAVETLESEFVLNSFAQHAVPVHYLNKEPCRLLDAAYFDMLGLSCHLMAESAANNLPPLNKVLQPELLLIDASEAMLNEAEKLSVQGFVDKGYAVGFITEMQPSQLQSQLTERWGLPVLSHPFSQRELKQFFIELLPSSNTVSEQPDDDHGREEQQFNGHVLVVEDNRINQLVIGDMLADMGLSYDLAEDGQKAVEKVNNGSVYDLVFMDIQMPIMDGHAATRQLRKDGHSDLIICGLSANAMQQDKLDAKASGMDDYMTKPIEWDDLLVITQKYLMPRN